MWLNKARPALAMAAACGLLLTMAGCDSPCSNDVIKTFPSPNGSKSAILIRGNCGATTSFTSQVSIANRGDTPTGNGNIFIADWDHGKAVAADHGGPWVDARWTSGVQLEIRYAAGSRIFKNETERDGVHIRYVAVKK